MLFDAVGFSRKATLPQGARLQSDRQGGGVEKLLEHVRQIYFAMALMMLGLGYLGLAARADNAMLSKEVRDLETLVETIKSLPTPQQAGAAQDQGSKAYEQSQLAKIYPDYLPKLQSENETEFMYTARVELLPEQAAHLFFHTSPTRYGAPLEASPTIRALKDQLDALEFRWLSLSPKALDLPGTILFPSMVLHAASWASVIKLEKKQEPKDATRLDVTFVVKPSIGPGEPRVISSSVQLRVLKLMPSFDERFPLLKTALSRIGRLTPDQLQKRLVENSDIGMLERKAKLFEVEIESRDVVFVLSFGIAACLLYGLSYLRDLASSSIATKTDDQLRELQAVWIGVHRNSLFLVGWAFILFAPITIYLVQVVVIGWSMLGMALALTAFLLSALSFYFIFRIRSNFSAGVADLDLISDNTLATYSSRPTGWNPKTGNLE
jgi:positive regulator of sigma E activity